MESLLSECGWGGGGIPTDEKLPLTCDRRHDCIWMLQLATFNFQWSQTSSVVYSGSSVLQISSIECVCSSTDQAQFRFELTCGFLKDQHLPSLSTQEAIQAGFTEVEYPEQRGGHPQIDQATQDRGKRRSLGLGADKRGDGSAFFP